MMTKEEYKKNLIKMWDSLRIIHKGEKECVGVNCRDCPLDKDFCNIYESIEIVENWAKEHPVKTNADKFKEVFGFDMTICWDDNPSCDGCPFYDGIGKCYSKEKFWNAEYKGKTEGCEEE